MGPLRGSTNSYVTGDNDPLRLREKPLLSKVHCMWGYSNGRGQVEIVCLVYVLSGPKEKKP